MRLDLNKILAYQNERVILRYHRDYPNAKMPGSQAFANLLKYIWLCLKHHQDRQESHDDHLQFKCVMHAEMNDIHKMWHTFLLFTKDYQDFCTDYLNDIFFHHEPMTEDGNGEHEATDDYALSLSRYLSYVYDHLGEGTLKEWFNECL